MDPIFALHDSYRFSEHFIAGMFSRLDCYIFGDAEVIRQFKLLAQAIHHDGLIGKSYRGNPRLHIFCYRFKEIV